MTFQMILFVKLILLLAIFMAPAESSNITMDVVVGGEVKLEIVVPCKHVNINEIPPRIPPKIAQKVSYKDPKFVFQTSNFTSMMAGLYSLEFPEKETLNTEGRKIYIELVENLECGFKYEEDNSSKWFFSEPSHSIKVSVCSKTFLMVPMIVVTQAQDNCVTTDHDGFCTSCPPNYGLDYPYNYTCLPCGDFCSSCVLKTSDSPAFFVPYCIACTSFFGLGKVIGTVNCAACADPNCRDCSGDYQRCASCEPEYGLDPAGPDANFIVCKPCSSTGCFFCSRNYKRCNNCKAGFQLKKGSCLSGNKCGDPRCIRCETSSCEECVAGFGLDPARKCSDKIVCKRCNSQDAHCKECAVVGTCTKCHPNKALVGGKCEDVPDQANRCNVHD